MPSASAKLEKQTSIEANDPLKQITTMVEKKVRNLEKRKAKLDSYRSDRHNGKELNDDQKKAIEKYDQVVEVLEFAKEMQKSFNAIVQETSKAQKKVAKREYLERQQQELQRIKEIMMIQDILNSMGGDVVRNDFLNGTNGAVKLTEDELNSLDELFKLICPERDMTSPDSSEFEKQLLSAAEHLQALLDSKNKEVIGTTYKVLKDTIVKIHSCNYFNKSEESTEQESSDPVPADEIKESLCDNFTEGDMQSQFAFHHVNDIKASVDESQGPVDRSFYQNETSTSFQDQNRPIQEVLPVQGNLNFLQESQIDLESPQLDQPTIPSHSVPSGYASNFVSASQPSVSQGLASPHFQQRPKEESNLSGHIAPTQVLSSSGTAATVQPPPHSTGLSFSGTTLQVQNSTTTPADFDPNRPIPTQTYTNQSFTTAIHPIMAAATGVAVPQNFVTLTHGITSQHILPATIVAQSVPQRSISTPSSGVMDPSSTLSVPAHSQPTGLPVSSSVSKMSLTTHDAKEHFNRNFHMPQVSRESHHMGKSGGSTQYERVNAHEGYQSTNNSQTYMGHESFSADSSSYSSNLKRGLPPRGVARGSGSRGGTANASRGTRSAYRN